MTRLRTGSSYWLDRGGVEAAPPRVLRGRHQADVVVVGGGITGCSTAYLLAASGARVVLAEAARIGHGSTAASTALLMQEPDTDFSGLTARYGADTAVRMWRTSRRAVQDFTATLSALHVRADAHAVPSVYYAHDDDAAATLADEHRLRRRHGIPSRWLTRRALAGCAGLAGPGALLTAGNAQADPYRACVGLAEAARTAGAAIYERSRVRRIIARAGGVEVLVKGGRVTAGHVVIATGYATAEFKPLAGRFRMMHTYVVATPPLAPAMQRRVGLGDVMVWNTARPYHYLRWTPDRRLLFGGGDRPASAGRRRRSGLEARTRALAEDLWRLYPAVSGVEPDYAWEGLFATTPDGLPYIGRHRRYPRHLFALGFGGNGMTFGFLAARILQRLLEGGERPDDTLFGFGRDSLRRRAAGRQARR